MGPGLVSTLKQVWLIRGRQWIRFLAVIQAVGNILWRQLRARHEFRFVKIDTTHFGVEWNWFGHRNNAHVLNGFVGVQAATHFGPRAFTVVWRGPVAHIVGVLCIAVVKDWIIWPQVIGRHVGNPTRCFERIIFIQYWICGCIGGRSRRQGKSFHLGWLIAHL